MGLSHEADEVRSQKKPRVDTRVQNFISATQINQQLIKHYKIMPYINIDTKNNQKCHKATQMHNWLKVENLSLGYLEK